jgi:hypothetical protein
VSRPGLLASTALAAPVTKEDLLHGQDNAADWLMYGRDDRNQRFSPLAQITPDNLKQLEPVWAFSTAGHFAGLEAPPLYGDGVLYITGSGLWPFEPEYPDGLDAKLCCGPGSRDLRCRHRHAYLGTGNYLGHRQRGPWNSDLGTGDNLWSSSLFAPRARSRHCQDQVGLSVHPERCPGL